MSCLPPRVRSHVTAAMAVALCLAVVSWTMASAMASESTTPGPGQPGSALPAKTPAQTLPAKAPAETLAEALVAKAPAETLAKALAAGQLVVPAGAAEQTADLRRRRLLAVIAAICMFGVTTAIIRAIVSQRTRRTVKG